MRKFLTLSLPLSGGAAAEKFKSNSTHTKMKKETYSPPRTETVEIAVEKGIAQSPNRGYVNDMEERLITDGFE